MTRTETILLKGLSTGYRSKHKTTVVAGDLSGTICSGELTCLLGPNGAGKSTLLRTLSAFLPPLGGEITLLGRPLREYSDRELSRVIGVVLTERVSLQNMTVEELVGMGRSPYTGFWGRLSEEDHAQVDAAITMVGIDNLRRRPSSSWTSPPPSSTIRARWRSCTCCTASPVRPARPFSSLRTTWSWLCRLPTASG